MIRNTNSFKCANDSDTKIKFEKYREQGEKDKKASTLPHVLNGFLNAKGMMPPEAYKAAHLERQIFDGMLNFKVVRYSSNRTLLQTAIGLGLTLPETETLLQSAGRSFRPDYLEDEIFKFAIENGLNMWEVESLAESYGIEVGYARQPRK